MSCIDYHIYIHCTIAPQASDKHPLSQKKISLPYSALNWLNQQTPWNVPTQENCGLHLCLRMPSTLLWYYE